MISSIQKVDLIVAAAFAVVVAVNWCYYFAYSFVSSRCVIRVDDVVCLDAAAAAAPPPRNEREVAQ